MGGFAGLYRLGRPRGGEIRAPYGLVYWVRPDWVVFVPASTLEVWMGDCCCWSAKWVSFCHKEVWLGK